MKTTSEYLQEYSNYKELQGARAKTIYEHQSRLRMFFEYMAERRVIDIRRVTEKMLQHYLYQLSTKDSFMRKKKLSTSTINGRILSIKDFYSFLIKREYIKENPLAFIITHRKEKHLPRQGFKQKEVKEVITGMLERRPQDKIYKLIIALSYHCALRISEALGLKKADVNLEVGMLTVEEGKGGYKRVIPLCQWMQCRLEEHMKSLSEECEWLFPSNKTEKHFEKTGLYWYIKKNIDPEKYKNVAITHHIFRYSIAKHLLENGLDIRYVQRFLGHKNIDTTNRYTQLDLSDLRMAMKTYHPREINAKEYLENECNKQNQSNQKLAS